MGWSAVVREAITGGVFARSGVGALGGGRGCAGGSAAPAFLGAFAGGSACTGTATDVTEVGRGRTRKVAR